MIYRRESPKRAPHQVVLAHESSGLSKMFALRCARVVSVWVLVVLVVMGGVGCREPLAIPRIEVSKVGVGDGYVGPTGIRIHAFDTGSIASVEGATWAGGSWTKVVKLHVFAFVIEHPKAGLIVFDTGLNDRARTDPGHYVGSIGRELGMIEMAKEQDLVSQMKAAGFDPEQVSMVIVSHLHFDHTGALESFPNAQVVISKAEKSAPYADPESAGSRPWWKMPDYVSADEFDDIDNWRVIDYDQLGPFASFVAHQDLLGDGSLIAINLAGHTVGSQGLLIRSAGAPVLLTGDAAWTDQSWRFVARPITAFDMHAWWEQAWRINRYHHLVTNAVIIPGHDLAALKKIKSPMLVLHTLGEVEKRADPKTDAADIAPAP